MIQFKMTLTRNGKPINTQDVAGGFATLIRSAPERLAKRLLFRLGREVAVDMTNSMRQGVTPYGARQKQNAESTQKLKALLGRPQIPLVDTGMLSNFRNYRIMHSRNSVEILPPRLRENVVKELRQRGYTLFEFPSDTIMSRMMARVYRNLSAAETKEIWGIK